MRSEQRKTEFAVTWISRSTKMVSHKRKALAKALKDKGINHIYSSPLSRAAKTAEIISQTVGADYETDEGFNNVCIGVWENRIKSELAAEVPEMWETWLNRPEDLVIEGGETLDKVRERSCFL